MNKKNILIVTYGGGHVQIAKELIKNLGEDNQYNIHCLALTMAYHDLTVDKDAEYKLYGIKDVFEQHSKVEKEEIYSIGKQLVLDNHNPNSKITKEESIMYSGIGYWNLEKAEGGEKAKERYNKEGRHAFLPMSTIKNFFNYIKPDVVIATTSPRFERASLLLANQLDIPSIQIDDLFGNNEAQFVAQNIIVFSEDIKEKLIKRSIPEKTIFPLGNLIFEKTYNEVNGITEDLRSKYNISSNIDNILLFAPHKDVKYNDKGEIIGRGNDYENHKKEFEVLSTITKSTNTIVIVRNHPNDPVKEYEPFVENEENIRIITPQEMPLIEAISLADIWVTNASTTGMQALVSGKKVITYNYKKEDDHMIKEYTLPPFIFAESLNTLKDTIENTLSLAHQDNTLNKTIVGATQRINSFIKNILK